MKQFIVSIPEVHYQDVVVDAENGVDAIAKVKEGEGLSIDNSLEYSHTSENEQFHIKEI